jgi:ATP-dependent Clp protease adaptor protein ClpS
MTKEKTSPIDFTHESIQDLKELILYNDDVNTFDFVIECLIDLCGHDPIQAEQCTLIVHYKGKCAVKSGSFSALKPVHDEMANRQLSVVID